MNAPRETLDRLRIWSAKPDADEEAKWRAEFEVVGESEVRNEIYHGSGVHYPDPKRRLAFLWLREKARATRRREDQTLRYVRWTFWTAATAVIIGLVGVIVGVIGVAVPWLTR